MLERPISSWVISTDRHLPQAFLGRPLREVLTLTFAELAGTPGIGSRRIEKLIDVLERTRQQPGTANATVDRQHPVASNDAPPAIGTTTPEDLSEPAWHSWCLTISAHRMECEPLGRFARSLSDLPYGLWSVPLREYANKSLLELRSMPGYGQGRVGQVIDVFARIAQTIDASQNNAPLAVRLVAPPVRDAVLWAEAVLRNGSVPEVQAIHEGFLAPLFAQLESDVGPETAAMVRRRIGVDGPAETLEEVASDVGLTRERVRQITAKAAQIFRIRWPEGRFLLDNVYAQFQASTGAEAQLEIMHSVLDACFSLEVTRGGSRSDVLASWDRAGRAKRTPMSEAALRSWASEEFPDLPSDVIRRWLEEDGMRSRGARR